MPKNNETKFIKEISVSKLSEYVNLPNPGLRSYFDIVKRGQPEEYRTTFARGSSLQEILADWNKTLISIKDAWPTLYEFEMDLAKKVGPMSIMRPLHERLDDVDSYYEGILLPSKPLLNSAIMATVAEWSKLGGLRLRTQQRTVEVMKKSTNSGAPYFSKRSTVTAKTVPCGVIKKGNDYIQILHDTEWKIAAILGWRGQEGGPNVDDVKQRVVWMFPYALNINELQMYQPLIESAQKFNLVPAWVSMEAVDERITRMFDTKGSNDLVVCTDFSKFDQHFNLKLQDAASQILQRLVTGNPATRSWFETVYRAKYEIPMLLQSDLMTKSGIHGMASGSGGTNADETLVHRTLQYESAILHNQRLNPNSQCLGDDGVLTYPGITVKDVVQSYTEHGLEMNESKQYASKHDCTYLRRWHHSSYRVDGICVGVYSTCRALGRLAEQERYYDPEIWGPKMVALRQLSILENVKYHPLRDKFAEFCMKRDKYRLGLDIPGFLDSIERIAQESIELIPDFLGYTKSMQPGAATGISNWWIVKYLKSKA